MAACDGKRAIEMQFGVEAIIDEITDSNPYCEHGPTLLFERFYAQGKSRRFFACSACRDRKQCSFFQWEDENVTDYRKMKQKYAANESTHSSTFCYSCDIKCKCYICTCTFKQKIKSQLYKKTDEKFLVLENDIWCHTCSIGAPKSEKNKHEAHDTTIITQNNLHHPSHLLYPKENNKTNAQYFFDGNSCNFLLETISKLNYRKIVCIGTPRLFEALQSKQKTSQLLLDIDKRFGQFYSQETFLQFNMFNNFFFDSNDRRNQLSKYIGEEKERVLLVIDPPFGGLINVLANTIKSIWDLGSSGELDTILIFPYFLESHVKEAIPSLMMSDYKISYDNHTTYNNNKINKKNARGSPVRMFTNIQLEKIVLPKENYRFCKICQKHVAKENIHCNRCNDCPSKDGRTYVHCNECTKCVKPGRKHCTRCNRCEVENHKCSAGIAKIGCHICGKLDHKRRDCPQRKGTASRNSGGKRKISNGQGKTKKAGKSIEIEPSIKKRKNNPKKKIRI